MAAESNILYELLFLGSIVMDEAAKLAKKTAEAEEKIMKAEKEKKSVLI